MTKNRVNLARVLPRGWLTRDELIAALQRHPNLPVVPPGFEAWEIEYGERFEVERVYSDKWKRDVLMISLCEEGPG